MNTQIMFKIDSRTKKAIQKRAKKEGISLSTFFRIVSKEFAAGRLDLDLIIE